MSAADGTELLTVKAAAARLDVSIRTLRRYIADGRLDACLLRPPFEPDPNRKGARRKHHRLVRVDWQALLKLWRR